MLPDRLAAYRNAPLGDLLAILLRQYRRPLADRGVHLTDAEAEALAGQIAARAVPDEAIQPLRAALVDLVAESEGVLARWKLSFRQSLDAQMTDLPGWESTAEFLEIANQKANAELRISTGAALLAALGDTRYAADLLFLVERDPNDLDAVIARRVLRFASGIESDDLDQLRAWVDQQGGARLL